MKAEYDVDPSGSLFVAPRTLQARQSYLEAKLASHEAMLREAARAMGRASS